MEPRFYEVLGLILCSSNSKYMEKNLVPIEPRYTEGPRDWQNMFAITRFCYIEVLFHIFYYYQGEENRQLYRGLLLCRSSLYRGSTVLNHSETSLQQTYLSSPLTLCYNQVPLKTYSASQQNLHGSFQLLTWTSQGKSVYFT